MKKRIFSPVIALGSALVFFLGVLSADLPAKTAYAAAEPDSGIEIDEEYLIPDSMDWCTYYVVVATNKSGKDINISADFVAKDKSGEVLRTVNDYSEAVKAGQKFMLYGQFLNTSIIDAASYEYSYSIRPTDRCAYSSVAIDASKDGDCVEVSATNGAEFDIQGVGIRSVFLKDGKAVAFDTVNIADEGTTFSSGSTNSQIIGMNAGAFDNFIITYTSVVDQEVAGDL